MFALLKHPAQSDPADHLIPAQGRVVPGHRPVAQQSFPQSLVRSFRMVLIEAFSSPMVWAAPHLDRLARRAGRLQTRLADTPSGVGMHGLGVGVNGAG